MEVARELPCVLCNKEPRSGQNGLCVRCLRELADTHWLDKTFRKNILLRPSGFMVDQHELRVHPPSGLICRPTRHRPQDRCRELLFEVI